MGITFILPSSGSSTPTGLPIPVADEAERLSMEPPEGTHVKQDSDGMVWVVFEGNWRKAPPLLADTQPEEVLDGVEFQSVSYPNVTSGTLEALTVTDTLILPAQAWCDNIWKFAISPASDTLTITGNATHIDVDMLRTRVELINSYFNPDLNIDLSGLALGYENVNAILASLYSFFDNEGISTASLDFSGGTNGKVSPLYGPLVGAVALGNTVTVNFTTCIAAGYTTTTGWSASGSSGVFGIATGDMAGVFHEAPHEISALGVVNATGDIGPVVFDFESLTNCGTIEIDTTAGLQGVANVPNGIQQLILNACTNWSGSLDLDGKDSLTSLSVTNMPVSGVSVADCDALAIVNVSGCSLTESALDALITDVYNNVVGNSIVEGLLNISSQNTMATPSSAVASMMSDLVTLYDWTITT